jgi:two-component system sensor histidine kinase/response regulator
VASDPRGLARATVDALRSNDAFRSIADAVRSRVGELAQWATSANAAPVDAVREAACELYDALDVLKLAQEKLNKGVDGHDSNGGTADSALGDADGDGRRLFGGIELIEAELRLRDRRIDELERANRAAEAEQEATRKLLANTSHDIRNPLNTLLGFGELLRETDLSPEQLRYIDALGRCGRQLLRLMGDLLDLSKAVAGRIEFDEVEFDLVELVEDAARDASLRWRGQDLDVTSRPAPGVPTRVVGDPMRLRQILDNLLENACKFTERGEVVLEVRGDSTGLEPRMIRFSVTDTGLGISPDNVRAVFEPFVQDGAQGGRKYRGAGLGLTITKFLVEKMGGTIEVESSVGHGTIVHVALPLAVAARAEESSLATRLAGVRVLVIDGNSNERTALVEMLGEWGAVVTEIEDGARGLAELQGNAPKARLILLAGRMPTLSGFKIVEALRGDPDLLRKTVFLLPMNHRRGDLEQLQLLGVGACVVTPVKRGELLIALLRTQSMCEMCDMPAPD